ncbi:MAG: hypothetical protein MR428_07165 [Mesosutterella sp.]|uniref:Uncharacterized protein n=1 Tax=Mesosutterella faecium TaxID=2925194 RepID=A0ABT7IR90_9BURK|nr:hypothetical protein [Mesosutterella sp. AGMB02718]MCI6530854.1 hypothetical protein [Mesosutterella sp.]MDL2060495.1 hypothetical protein [Mesosutterella sp. AGMB02718]
MPSRPWRRACFSRAASCFDIRADVLVTIALAASIAPDEVFAAGEVALIMQLGSLLEDKTAARVSSGS